MYMPMFELMEYLINMPAYVKVGTSFFGILLASRAGLPLGYAIVLFSAALSLWTGAGGEGLVAAFSSLLHAENFLLTILVFVLLFFTESLDRSGRIRDTIDSLQAMFGNRRLLFSGMPALIGLLPMPGGALFSAPLVASMDQAGELDTPHKAAVNYWFRHIWEYWWPLYPGVILAVRYSELPYYAFLAIQFPFTLAAAAGGYFFILRKIEKRPAAAETGAAPVKAFSALGPILLLVAVSVAGSALLPYAGWTGIIASEISMLAGLFLALTVVFAGRPDSLAPSLQLFSQGSTWKMIVLVAGIQVFSAVLKAPAGIENGTLVTMMRDEFVQAGIPIVSLIMLIPFISGLVTGVAFGFVGTSFPIVFALAGPNPDLGALAATTACAYGFGYMGMMISPVHICFVVTCEYFRSPLLSAYRYLAGPVAVVLFASLILSGLYYLAL